MIPVPLSVNLGDTDGSETYIMQITDVFPAGIVLYGANGGALAESGGVYTLQPIDVESFSFLPTLHWSSAVQGDVVITTTTIVTDSSGSSSSQSTTDLTITVKIEGVADKPNSKSILVTGTEDNPYDLGGVLDISGVLVDNDTSESLFMLIKGLPSGVVPSSSSGEVAYIGSGRWQISSVGFLQFSVYFEYHLKLTTLRIDRMLFQIYFFLQSLSTQARVPTRK